MPSTVFGADVRRKRALELLAVNAVIHPFIRGRDPLAAGDCCGVSNHRHEIAVPTRLRPQDAEPILRVVKGHTLDETRQHLLGRCFRLRTHRDTASR
jgi:hypothetical protein